MLFYQLLSVVFKVKSLAKEFLVKASVSFKDLIYVFLNLTHSSSRKSFLFYSFTKSIEVVRQGPDKTDPFCF